MKKRLALLGVLVGITFMMWPVLNPSPMVEAYAGHPNNPDGDENNGSRPARETAATSDDFRTDILTGRFEFEIPIDLPPGRLGMQPTLSLGYSSEGGPSWVGYGWGLSGLGEIRRTGARGGVPDYDDSDGYYLSGAGANSELMIDPDDPDPANATRYSTIQESFLRIKRDRTANRWLVRAPNGFRFYFGYTADSQIEAVRWDDGATDFTTGTGFDETRTWALSRVEDPNGNVVDITYTEGDTSADPTQDGDYYPKEILYTRGNGVDTGRVVEFVLESRPDEIPRYDTGSRVLNDRRLGEIKVWSRFTRNVAAGDLYAKYALSYRPHDAAERDADVRNWITPHSKLVGVQRFGTDGSTAYPPYTLHYTESTPGWSDEPETYTGFPIPFVNWREDEPGLFIPYDNGARIAELDGNGLLDQVQRYKTGVSSYEQGVRIHEDDHTWTDPGETVPETIAYLNNDGGVQLYDIDGDYLSDFIRLYRIEGTPGLRNIQLRRHTPTFQGWVTPDGGSWHPNIPLDMEFVVSLGSSDPRDHGTRAADFNGDGYTDLISSRTCAGCQKIRFLRADGTWWDPGWNVPTPFVEWTTNDNKGEDYGRRLEDFNGDGLPDIGYARSPSSGVYFNTGAGFYDDPIWAIPAWLVNSGNTTGVRFGDVNRDGLVDILTQSSTMINNGAGFFYHSGIDPPFAFQDLSGFDWGIRLADFDGDGLLDVTAGFDCLDCPALVRALGEYPGLLREITLPTGGRVAVGYSPSSQFDNTDDDGMPQLPFVRQVVTSITTDDGMGTPESVATTTFSYEGGLYDKAARRFVGFEHVTQTDPPNVGETEGTYSITTFYLTEERRGKVRKVLRYGENGGLLTQRTFGYNYASFFQLDYTPPYDNPLRVDITWHNQWIEAKWHDYDEYGNLTLTHVWGEGYIQGPGHENGDERTYVNVYRPLDDGVDYLVSLPAIRDRLYEGIVSDAETPGWIQQTELVYGSNSTWDSVPDGINVTQETTRGADGSVVFIRSEYDVFGNVESTTDEADFTTQLFYEENPGVHAAGTLPTRIVNAAGQTVSFGYDKHGNQTSYVEENGIEEVSVFDEFHRPQHRFMLDPDPADPDPVRLPERRWFYNNHGSLVPGDLAASQHTRMEVRHAGSDWIFEEEYFDGLNRTYANVHEGATPSQDVRVDTAYTLKGQPWKLVIPYYRDSPPALPLFVEAFQYDGLNRLVSLAHPDSPYTGGTNYRHYLYSYAQIDGIYRDMMGSRNERGFWKYDYLDAFGRVMRTREDVVHPDAPAGYFETNYEYDVLDNLTRIIDHEGNATMYAYDDLGRRTSMIHPDRGAWVFEHDVRGKLWRTTDARGERITITYDALSRQTRIEQPNGDFEEIVYDESGHGASLGRPPTRRAVKDGTETWRKEFFYNRIGQLERKLESITALGVTKQFQLEYAYNHKGNAETIVYHRDPPTGTTETVTFSYLPSGQLYSVVGNSSYVSEIHYTAQGMQSLKVFGNGAFQKYTYYDQPFDSPSLRLKRIQAGSDYSGDPQAPGAFDLLDRMYSYDFVGNIDTIDASTSDVSGGWTRSYTYDELDRLLTAGEIDDSLEFTYDSMHNRTSLEGEYAPFGTLGTPGPYERLDFVHDATPHRLTRVIDANTGGVTTFTYDANGNLVERRTPTGSGFDLELVAGGTTTGTTGTNSGSTVNGRDCLDESDPPDPLGGGNDGPVDIEQKPPCDDGPPPVPTPYSIHQFYYDAQNRLASVARDGLLVEEYRYDGAGQRIAKITYDDLGQNPVATYYFGEAYEIRGTTQINYYHANGQRVARRAAGPFTRWFYLSDHLGSSALVLNRFANVVKHLDYYPYGEPKLQTGTIDPVYTYNGRELDRSGYYYYSSRYYDARLARFASADVIEPIVGNSRTLNPYAYVNNNPMRYVDPDGRNGQTDWRHRTAAWIDDQADRLASKWDYVPNYGGVGSIIRGVGGALSGFFTLGDRLGTGLVNLDWGRDKMVAALFSSDIDEFVEGSKLYFLGGLQSTVGTIEIATVALPAVRAGGSAARGATSTFRSLRYSFLRPWQEIPHAYRSNVFTRVMDKKYVQAFLSNKGKLSPSDWAHVTTPDQLAGVATETGVVKRLTLVDIFKPIGQRTLPKGEQYFITFRTRQAVPFQRIPGNGPFTEGWAQQRLISGRLTVSEVEVLATGPVEGAFAQQGTQINLWFFSFRW